MAAGKVSSKYQLTLPVGVRRALGIKPGDRVRYDIQEGKLSISIVRPDVAEELEKLWQEYELSALHVELGSDAAAYVRKQRGWEDDWCRQQHRLFSY